MDAAASVARAEMLPRVLNHGSPVQGEFESSVDFNSRICRYAAGNGHLAVLQWARAQGCPWDEWTCQVAAENGHLGVLQ